MATYELDRIDDPRARGAIDAGDAAGIARSLMDAPPFRALSKPVCGACALARGGEFDIAVTDAAVPAR